MLAEAIHHTVFNLDVQGSGGRTDPAKLAMRDVLYDVVSRAFDDARTGSGHHLEDRGDGLLGVVPADVAKSRLLGLWLATIDRELRHRNAEGVEEPIRVRIGIHAGEVHRDAHGVAGGDVDLACRLADAPALRGTLDAAHAACVAVAVSDVLYQSVVRHGGPYILPAHYARIRVRIKEVDTPAWITVPGYSVPPVPPDDRVGAPRRPASPHRPGGDRETPGAGGGHRPGSRNSASVSHSVVGQLHVGDSNHDAHGEGR